MKKASLKSEIIDLLGIPKKKKKDVSKSCHCVVITFDGVMSHIEISTPKVKSS